MRRDPWRRADEASKQQKEEPKKKEPPIISGSGLTVDVHARSLLCLWLEDTRSARRANLLVVNAPAFAQKPVRVLYDLRSGSCRDDTAFIRR